MCKIWFIDEMQQFFLLPASLSRLQRGAGAPPVHPSAPPLFKPQIHKQTPIQTSRLLHVSSVRLTDSFGVVSGPKEQLGGPVPERHHHRVEVRQRLQGRVEESGEAHISCREKTRCSANKELIWGRGAQWRMLSGSKVVSCDLLRLLNSADVPCGLSLHQISF